MRDERGKGEREGEMRNKKRIEKREREREKMENGKRKKMRKKKGITKGKVKILNFKVNSLKLSTLSRLRGPFFLFLLFTFENHLNLFWVYQIEIDILWEKFPITNLSHL